MDTTTLRQSRTARLFTLWATFCILSVCTAAAAHAGQQSNNPNELARQGWEAIQSKRYGEALKSFAAATDLAPEWAGLW